MWGCGLASRVPGTSNALSRNCLLLNSARGVQNPFIIDVDIDRDIDVGVDIDIEVDIYI